MNRIIDFLRLYITSMFVFGVLCNDDALEPLMHEIADVVEQMIAGCIVSRLV